MFRFIEVYLRRRDEKFRAHNLEGGHTMKHLAYSGSLTLMLVSIVAAAILLLPTVARSQNPEWMIFTPGNSGLPYDWKEPLAFDAQGNLWIGTWSGGLAKFDGESWQVYESGLPDNPVHSLAVDSQGNLWIGTAWFGVRKFDGAGWEVYDTGNSRLPSNWVTSLAEDSQGNLWIGTLQSRPHHPRGGLAMFDGERWAVYNTDNSALPDSDVWSLTFDPQGNLWIGTGTSESSPLVEILNERYKGNLWIGAGTSERGLTKFDGENWEVVLDGGGDCFRDCFTFDSQGNLWSRTDYGWGGLAKFDGENWTAYTTENSGLPDGFVVSVLAFDPQGNLWIGTGSDFLPGRGLAKFDGETWQVYDTGNSGLPDNTVTSLTFDSQGNLWIGTGATVDSQGLAVYREGGVILPGVTVVGEELDTKVPSAFCLSQNYPNPFNAHTTIAYDVPQATHVTLTIYTITGQKVATVVSGHQEAGHYSVAWEGSGFATGIYFYRLKAGQLTETKRMLLLK